jgi:hypothetical protein
MRYYIVGGVLAIFSEILINVWLLNIPISWPFILVHSFIPFLVYAYIASKRELAEDAVGIRPIGIGISTVVIIVCGLIFFAILIFGEDISHAKDLRKMGHVKTLKLTNGLTDWSITPIVPKKLAINLGQNFLSEKKLYSDFEFTNFFLEKVGKEIYWIAPLSFRGFDNWSNKNRISPGYIKINAQDLKAQPKLVTGLKMRYTFGAWFGNSIHRYLYLHGYAQDYLADPIFEIDDRGKPYYVISIINPTIGFTGNKVKGIILLNPQNGQLKFYPLGKIPTWIDHVFPEDLLEQYANWWGVYVHGWGNAHNANNNRDVQEICDDTIEDNQDSNHQKMVLVYNSKKSQFLWIASMFSQEKGQYGKITGYISADSRTGKMSFYPAKGYLNSQKALAKIIDRQGYDNQNDILTQPILSHLGNNWVWIVSVMTRSNVVNKVAIVDAKTGRVAIGPSKEKVLAFYQEHLFAQKFVPPVQFGPPAPKIKKPDNIQIAKRLPRLKRGVKGSSSKRTTAKNKKTLSRKKRKIETGEDSVGRINQAVINGQSRFYLMFTREDDRVYEIDGAKNPEVLATTPSDQVRVHFYSTKEKVIPVISFNNLNIDPIANDDDQSSKKRKLISFEARVKVITKAVINGQPRFYLKVSDHPDRIYEVALSVSPEILAIEVDDSVKISCYPTRKKIVPVVSFDDLFIDIKGSKNYRRRMTFPEEQKVIDKKDLLLKQQILNDQIIKLKSDLAKKQKQIEKQLKEIDQQLKNL